MDQQIAFFQIEATAAVGNNAPVVELPGKPASKRAAQPALMSMGGPTESDAYVERPATRMPSIAERKLAGEPQGMNAAC